MVDFKVGDRITCVNEDSQPEGYKRRIFKHYNTYVVKNLNLNSDHVKIEGFDQWFRNSRFELWKRSTKSIISPFKVGDVVQRVWCDRSVSPPLRSERYTISDIRDGYIKVGNNYFLPEDFELVRFPFKVGDIIQWKVQKWNEDRKTYRIDGIRDFDGYIKLGELHYNPCYFELVEFPFKIGDYVQFKDFSVIGGNKTYVITKILHGLIEIENNSGIYYEPEKFKKSQIKIGDTVEWNNFMYTVKVVDSNSITIERMELQVVSPSQVTKI